MQRRAAQRGENLQQSSSSRPFRRIGPGLGARGGSPPASTPPLPPSRLLLLLRLFAARVLSTYITNSLHPTNTTDSTPPPPPLYVCISSPAGLLARGVEVGRSLVDCRQRPQGIAPACRPSARTHAPAASPSTLPIPSLRHHPPPPSTSPHRLHPLRRLVWALD